MDKITLTEDVPVVCIAAKSFPGNVKEAYERLYVQVPDHQKRTTYGISTLKNGKLMYKAAFSLLAGDEPDKWGVEADVIKKGEYISETINDFENHRDQFQSTFEKLGDSDFRTGIPGIEWYQGRDVKCMLPLLK